MSAHVIGTIVGIVLIVGFITSQAIQRKRKRR